MGGASEIEVYPEKVAAVRDDVLAIQQNISGILASLKGKLPGGAPWGSNDGGKEFGDSYGKSRDNAFSVTDNAVNVLGTIANGHDAAGKALEETDAQSAQ